MLRVKCHTTLPDDPGSGPPLALATGLFKSHGQLQSHHTVQCKAMLLKKEGTKQTNNLMR